MFKIITRDPQDLARWINDVAGSQCVVLPSADVIGHHDVCFTDQQHRLLLAQNLIVEDPKSGDQILRELVVFAMTETEAATAVRLASVNWTLRKNNFLLRSKYTEPLIRVLVAAEAGQVQRRNSMYSLNNANGAWRAHCTDMVMALARQGYLTVIRREDRADMWTIRPTVEGLCAVNAINRNKSAILDGIEEMMCR